MKRVTAAAILLVALASPLQAQTSTTGTADSGGVTRTNMNSTTTPSGTNSNMNTTTTPSNNMNNTNYNNGATTPSGTTSTGATDNDVNGSAGTRSKLPATASPLPLLSLGSLAALASGLWLSRRRQA